MNKSAKKLVLNKTTIRALQPEELARVAGGNMHDYITRACGSQDYCAGPYQLGALPTVMICPATNTCPDPNTV